MAWHSWDSTYQSFQHTSTTARVAGTPERVGDTICFPAHDAAANEQATMIYATEQVTVDKSTAANRGVIDDPGDKVRVNTATGDVEDDGGTASATLVDCGVSLEAAVQAATELKIKFDGTPAMLRA